MSVGILSVGLTSIGIMSAPNSTYQQQYQDIILKNHYVVSCNKFDLGLTDTLLNEIALKTEEPVNVHCLRSLMHIVKK
jgi:hypothetical protein